MVIRTTHSKAAVLSSCSSTTISKRDLTHGSLNMYNFLEQHPSQDCCLVGPQRAGTKILDIGSGPQFGTTYFFVITSYDTSGNESSWSTELSKRIF